MNNIYMYLLFIVSGGVSVIFNLMTRMLLNCIFPFEFSVAVSYIVGVLVAFVMMKTFVFKKSNGTTKQQFLKFTLVNCYGFLQTIFLSHIFLRILNRLEVSFIIQNEFIAHFVALGCLAISSFILHFYFTFKSHRTVKND